MSASVDVLTCPHCHQPVQESVKIGNLEVFLSGDVFRDSQPIKLTRREFQVLWFMAKKAGQSLTRTQIVEAVWGYEFQGLTNIVDVYVRYLREKLGHPWLIQTVRGVGYTLAENKQ